MAEPASRLVVKLGETIAGEVELRGNTVRFTLDPAYMSTRPRPVLGQLFEDDPGRVRSTHQRLTPWFSNLLPERAGALREVVARQLGIHPDREFLMIAGLGRDLPGNVTVEALDRTVSNPVPDSGPPAAVPLRFSLAGVQFKLSVLRDHRGFTFPAGGEGGNWIVKLPVPGLDHVPENEFSMMTWLRESGVVVPRIGLPAADRVRGIPADVVERGARVFAIERFDRGPGGRQHIEDFAQIFNVYPEGKYENANYESFGRVLLNIAGAGAVREFVRRLVAVVVIGNGDAHLKNWSVLYRDPMRAELSPAYDFVSTVVYHPFRHGRLALNLDRSKDFDRVTAGTFRNFGERIGYPQPAELETLAASFAERMRTTWTHLAGELPLPGVMAAALTARLRDLPLLRGSG